MLPLLPLAIIALAGGAAVASGKRKDTNTPGTKGSKGGMTPERQIVYETALNNVKEPEKLKALAVAFKNEGLAGQAKMLEKRAKLRELPADVKAQRRDSFRKAMASKDPSAVRNLANAFEKEGATGAATKLRQYATSLEVNKNMQPAAAHG